MTTATRLAREGRTFLKNVLEENRDLTSRLQQLSVTIAYDRDDDTFLVTLGEPQEALTESLAGGHLYLRVDPESLKIMGIEIPDLTTRLADDARVKRVWLAARNIAGPCNATEVPETVADASERLTHELSKLAAAR